MGADNLENFRRTFSPLLTFYFIWYLVLSLCVLFGVISEVTLADFVVILAVGMYITILYLLLLGRKKKR